MVCEFAGALKSEKAFVVSVSSRSLHFLTCLWVYFLSCVDSCAHKWLPSGGRLWEELARKDWKEIALILTAIGT